MAFLQRFDQVGIDHRHATPGIDEQRFGIETLEHGRVIQVMGCRRIGQQVDDVIGIADQPPKVLQRGHFDKWRLLASLAGNTVKGYTKWQQELGNALADVPRADDQHPAPGQATARAAIPLALDLADQARQHFALMAKHVGQDVLGHDLAKDANGAGQAVVLRQALGQQRGNTGPGRLQPTGLMPLAQQGRQ
ncbi:hypothetical protein D3C80_706730 [compost metagenome]